MHSVTLTWDPTPNATSYIVNRGTTQTGPFVQIGTPTVPLFIDSSPEVQVEGSTFYYEVLAVDSAGDSAPSLVVAAHIPFSVPGAPTNLVATVV
jgi:hypothetical protein